MLSTAMAQRSALWPIDKLVPYARNARTHSDSQAAQVVSHVAKLIHVSVPESTIRSGYDAIIINAPTRKTKFSLRFRHVS